MQPVILGATRVANRINDRKLTAWGARLLLLDDVMYYVWEMPKRGRRIRWIPC